VWRATARTQSDRNAGKSERAEQRHSIKNKNVSELIPWWKEFFLIRRAGRHQLYNE